MHGGRRDRRDSIRSFRSRLRVRIRTTVGFGGIGGFTCFRTEQLIFLLEFFEPDRAVHLGVAFLTPHRRGKEPGLISDDIVAQRELLSLMISRPIRQSPFNIRKLAFGSLDG